MIRRFLRGTNVAYFSLLGGIAISASVGVYTSLVIRSELPARWPVLAAAAVIFAVGGWLWTLLAVELGAIRGPIDNAPPKVSHADREAAWQRVYKKKKKYLFSLLFGALLTSIFALILLPFGPLADQRTTIWQPKSTGSSGNE